MSHILTDLLCQTLKMQITQIGTKQYPDCFQEKLLMSSQDYPKVKVYNVSKESDEFGLIAANFRRTSPNYELTSIVRVQIPHQWDRFIKEKERQT